MMQAQDFPLISHSPKRWAAFLKTQTPILESIVPLDSRGKRYWNMLGDKELVAHTNWRNADDGIQGKGELNKRNIALYAVLRKRGLLDELKLEGKRKVWKTMKKEELVAFAKRFVEEKKIRSRGALEKADSKLYQALMRRMLLDEIGISNSNSKDRDWDGKG